MSDYKWDGERSEKALAFLSAIEKVCREFNISLSHEDAQGAFELEPFSEQLLDWLKEAKERKW